jgi:K+ transporter
MKIDKMGVLVLMSHLIITLAVLAIYAIGSIQGHGDETLKTVLTVIIGYWFGSMGAQALRGKSDTTTTTNDETKKGA